MKAALVGNNIGPSLTPAMHEAEGAALGLGYSYERIDTALGGSEPLDMILQRARSEGFHGLNITHPHKIAVVPFLDRLDGAAAELGAVNTVVLRDGERVGHNTDYSGFRTAVSRRFGRQAGVSVLQLGAGGAGAAVALALADVGAAEVIIVDPAEGRAQALADRSGQLRPGVRFRAETGINYDAALKGVTGVVNCTPLGMADHPGMAIDPARLSPATWVADIVYFPRETALLRAARANGCPVMDGTAMALWQAVAAFELITGHKPDPARMERCLSDLIAHSETSKDQVA